MNVKTAEKVVSSPRRAGLCKTATITFNNQVYGTLCGKLTLNGKVVGAVDKEKGLITFYSQVRKKVGEKSKLPYFRQLEKKPR